MGALIDRGRRGDKDLEEALAYAKSSGSLQNVNTFQGLLDAANEEHMGGVDKTGIDFANEEWRKNNPNFTKFGPSAWDVLSNKGGARDNLTMDQAMAIAGPSWMMGPLSTPATIISTIANSLTNSAPYGTYNRFGMPFEISQSTGGDDKGEFFSAYSDFPDIDYGNDYVPQQVPVQNLDPNIAAGAFDRNAALEELIGRTQGNTINPGIGDYYFNDIIRRGLTGRDQDLGENITENQFNNAFASDFLGQGLLDEETGMLQGRATDQLNSIFTGNAFDPLDDSIINSIVQERSEPARKQISTAVARGNYNPTGGRTANQAIDFQTPAATSRVREIGEGVLGGYGKDISALKDTAQAGISGFKLGDDLFDVSPFAEQRSNLIQDKSQSLQGDISDAIGSEPLFSSGDALAKGGRVQGVVSGQPLNQSFLDTIAAREAQGARSSRTRGLGSRGSGVF